MDELDSDRRVLLARASDAEAVAAHARAAAQEELAAAREQVRELPSRHRATAPMMQLTPRPTAAAARTTRGRGTGV
jgi:hypothetical protein